MKNYPRCFPVTEEMVESWTSCSYVGETTRTHDQILDIGEHALPKLMRIPQWSDVEFLTVPTSIQLHSRASSVPAIFKQLSTSR